MPCCSVPGTWTGTDTPGDMSPVWLTEVEAIFIAITQQSHILIFTRMTNKLTGVGAGRGRSLEMGRGVR